MIADIQQGSFSHCKCQNCNHIGLAVSFNPEMVPLSESKIGTWTITQPSEGIEVNTINYTCPICGSHYVEPLFPNEVN